jgi:hypothetical protein
MTLTPELVKSLILLCFLLGIFRLMLFGKPGARSAISAGDSVGSRVFGRVVTAITLAIALPLIAHAIFVIVLALTGLLAMVIISRRLRNRSHL